MNDPGEHVGGEFIGGGIDGLDLCGFRGGIVCFAEDFELWLDHLEAVAIGGDLSGGADEHSGLEFFVEAVGVEPCEDAAAAFGGAVGAVAGGVFEECFEAARLSRDEAGLQDGSADGRHIAGLNGGNGRFVGVMEVIAREIKKQVAAGADAEGGEFSGADFADVLGVKDGSRKSEM